MTPFTINESTVDPWTAVHFASGMAARAIGLPLWVTFLLAILFEYFELAMERWFPRVFAYRTGDTFRNQAGDVAGATAGWLALDALLRLDVSTDT